MSFIARISSASLLFAMLIASMVRGERVEFDAVASVPAREIHDPEFAAAYPRHKLVALRFSVSVMPASSSEVEECSIQWTTPSSEFTVIDYAPKTTLDTRVAGNVEVRADEEHRFDLEAHAAGFAKHITGAEASLSRHDYARTSSAYALLPPLELVSAAGTIERGRGAYFKLKPSPRTTLEGARDYVIVARVPKQWRGAVARIHCRATVRENTIIPGYEESHEAGRRSFLTAVYLEGDASAQQAAQRLLDAERSLQRTARERSRDVERQAYRTVWQKVGLADPKVSHDWLNQWIFGPTSVEIAARLPEPVRDDALRFAAARTELHRLSGEAIR